MDAASGGPASVARRLLEEVLNHGRLDLIEDLVAEDAVEHEALPISTGEMRSDLRAWLTELRSAFPDYHVQIEDVVAEGEKVVIRERITGTNLGALLGMPPTGRSISIDGFDMVRVHGGRIVEHW
ncbi:MAG TPA: ester cyclase, partial [Actinomycetota bacterium]|nr:ester cyclase [Actinomycetota bacterium]